MYVRKAKQNQFGIKTETIVIVYFFLEIKYIDVPDSFVH